MRVRRASVRSRPACRAASSTPTDEQTLGPEGQRTALAAWCKTACIELVAVHEDLGVSGGAPLERRAGLLAAIEALHTHRAGVLLVTKRDRLARDTLVAAMVERLVEREGARVVSVDGAGNGDGPEASLLRRVVDAFCEYERALIKSRTRSALAVKKSRGERVGEIPFGHRLAADGRTLELDAGEQRALALIHQLRASGKSIRGIAAELDARAVPARGRRWHSTSIARILRRDVE